MYMAGSPKTTHYRSNGFLMPQELVDIMIEEQDETLADAEEEPDFDDTDFVDEYYPGCEERCLTKL
jgi:hypothetical protein